MSHETLDQKLKSYTEMNPYPFHMPGHKRQQLPYLPAFPECYGIDITEIDGFDNLHHAEGVLQEAQKRAADLYGAKEAWYLINGSTCGLLAAISAAVPKGAKILTARNCHKAVYHALYLRELVPVYLYPEITSQGLQGQISLLTIRNTIRENPDAKALVITSPTYDGILSDIESIADLAHEAGMILIVDQAHGAHFGLDKGMPPNAGHLGADLVVVSVHKTLPAFTQTALLLSYSDRVEKLRVESFLDIYETSSPSYLLMAGIDRCVEVVKEKGAELFAGLRENLDYFYYRTGQLTSLKVLTGRDFSPDEAFFFDDSKILILTQGAGISGAELAETLRREYRIELEMASGNYGLALTSFMDTREGFERLSQAILELDQKLIPKSEVSGLDPEHFYQKRRRIMEIHQAVDSPVTHLDFREANGRVCGNYIYLYPPGIPMAVPGEVLEDDLIRSIKTALNAGLEVCGLTEDEKISVVSDRKEDS